MQKAPQESKPSGRDIKYMICESFGKNLMYVFVFGLAGLCSLGGCGQTDYKADADKKAYSIIDQKWQKDFGSKANYKISDTEPSPNAIEIAKAVPAGAKIPGAGIIGKVKSFLTTGSKDTLIQTAADGLINAALGKARGVKF